jgi:sugar phosphate isomerase/epimerase
LNGKTVYISSSSIIESNVIEAVNKLMSITRNIELSGGASYNPGLLENLVGIKKDKSVNFLLHGYFPPPQDHFILNFADTGDKTRNFIRESMSFVTKLDVPYYSIHTGFKKNYVSNEYELLFEAGDSSSYSIDDMKENIEWFHDQYGGMRIAIENMYPNNNNTECAYLMHVDDILSFYNEVPNVFLLLDLGHLKISSKIFGFDYRHAVDRIFDACDGKILEIHLSENGGDVDSHRIITSDSDQYFIIRRYASLIRSRCMNITLEARNYSLDALAVCYNLIDTALTV